MYHYVGLHWLCKLAVILSLLWAAPNTGHAAVWIGVSHGTDKWVQVGIEQQTMGPPQLYVEWRYSRHAYPRLLAEPWDHQPARVVIQRKGHAMWRAGLRDLWTPWTYIRYSSRCSVLELGRNAHGAALIGRRLVAG